MSFTIVLPSSKGTPINQNGDVQYQFNWSALQEGQYLMEFEFTGAQKNVAYAHPYLIAVDNLGALNDVYFTSLNTTGAIQTTGIVGAVRPELVAGTATYYLSAKRTDNPSVALKQRPSSNIFNVRFYDLDGTTIYQLVENYTLILHFKKI